MGSCLGKHKPKRNSICPSNIEAAIRKRISKSASPDDVRRQLESGKTDLSFIILDEMNVKNN